MKVIAKWLMFCSFATTKKTSLSKFAKYFTGKKIPAFLWLPSQKDCF